MADDETRETDVQESDPNADSASGLAGDMGVSSERVGPLRGGGEGTYGAEQVKQPTDDEHEKVADVGEETERPDTDLPEHPFDPGSASGHSHG